MLILSASNLPKPLRVKRGQGMRSWQQSSKQLRQFAAEFDCAFRIAVGFICSYGFDFAFGFAFGCGFSVAFSVVCLIVFVLFRGSVPLFFLYKPIPTSRT